MRQSIIITTHPGCGCQSSQGITALQFLIIPCPCNFSDGDPYGFIKKSKGGHGGQSSRETLTKNNSYIDIHNEMIYGFELTWVQLGCYIDSDTNKASSIIYTENDQGFKDKLGEGGYGLYTKGSSEVAAL
ncbi:hypothetical protein Prudu_019200 [Prunus dulcis]|uniref:Uncharacterized protein n=1 Tax=Prunus dulcis TaxID=3755 RepID=A0A4Y1RU35_PRUDU|nr:hypothetical protein Prudu_019200 [Prunus dulcis]